MYGYMKRIRDRDSVIFAKMLDVTEVKNAAELAEMLGKSKQAAYAAIKKDKVPAGWATEVACLTGCSLDWLIFGDGEQQVDGSHRKKAELLSEIAKCRELSLLVEEQAELIKKILTAQQK